MTRTFLAITGICLLICSGLLGMASPAQADDAELSEEHIPDTLPDDVFDMDESEAEALLLEEEGIGDGDESDAAVVEADEPESDAFESAQPDAPADMVDTIVIGGNDRVEEEAIRIRTSALPGTALNRDTVDADIRSIYDMGFFHNVEARFEREGGRNVLTYWVSERPLIREIHFEGNKKIDKEALEVALKIHPRTILNPVRVRRGIEDAKKSL